MPNANATILLLGATGQVGHKLRSTLAPIGTIHAPDRTAVDLAAPSSLRQAIVGLNPDLIVNAAAYTDVDEAEGKPGRAACLNAEAPRVLAETAKEVETWLIHYSTDYVFGGAKCVPYDETDDPNPINTYGRTKQVGEEAIRSVRGRHIILRTSWVYSCRRSNFVRTMLRLASENDQLAVVDDQIGVPTWAGWLAKATASICVRLLEAEGSLQGGSPRDSSPKASSPRTGCYHLTGTGQTSWYGFAQAIFSQFEQTGITVDPVSSDEYDTAAPRPAYTALDSSRVRATFDLPAVTWTEQLSCFRRHVALLEDELSAPDALSAMSRT